MLTVNRSIGRWTLSISSSRNDMARRVKSLQNQNIKSKNHRQHGSVREFDHNRKVQIRLQIRNMVESMQRAEEERELQELRASYGI